jgi:hypothetical protein
MARVENVRCRRALSSSPFERRAGTAGRNVCFAHAPPSWRRRSTPLAMHPMQQLSLLVGLFAVALAAQDPRKPPPSPQPFTPETKTGPTVPYVPAPWSRRTSGGVPKQASLAARTAAGLIANQDQVLFDAAPDGTIRAAAARYKAGFSRAGAEFVPFFGSQAPRNYPVTFRLGEVTLAGAALPLACGTNPTRTERTVSFDRGALLERYELSGAGMEQSFVFTHLDRRGALVIRMTAASDLPAAETADAIEFNHALGKVTYGKAFVLDARGRREPIERRWTGNGIEITVPEHFVAQAELPLVVDPLVGSSSVVYSNSFEVRAPDIAYDASADRYMVCFEVVFSATDSDVLCYELSSLGSPVGGPFTIDVSPSESWQSPRIANDNAANRHLVVAQVSAGGVSPFSIRGRTVAASSGTTGGKFAIATPGAGDPGDKIRPDVAGDPHVTPPTYFTVVWERVFSTTDHDIHARQVTNAVDPALVGTGRTEIDNSPALEEQPQISSSMGAPAPNAGVQKAMVVYVRRIAGASIMGRLIRWDGSLDPGYFLHSTTGAVDNPTASAAALPDGAGNHLYLVAWQYGIDADDVMAVLCKQPGHTVSPVFNLQQLETDPAYPGFGLWDQFEPRIATDGHRFAVAYNEDFENRGDLDGRVTTVHAIPVSPTQWFLGVTESRAWPAHANTIERGIVIASRYECAATTENPQAFTRYGLAWSDDNGTADDGVRAQVYDGMRATGGLSMVATACGGLGIASASTPALGESMQVSTTGAMGLLFGVPQTPPILLCVGSTCRLGVAAASFVTLPSQVAFPIPLNVFLLGGTVAFQGYTIAGGPCFGGVAVSDTLLVQIR